MKTVKIPTKFNESPIRELTVVHDFKKYVFNAGEEWSVDDKVAEHFVDTFPFVIVEDYKKNVKRYTPLAVGNPNYLQPKILGQEPIDSIDGLPTSSNEGFYGPGVETDNI